MNPLPRTSLEQWAVLRCIVEQGGFSQAAETLHRSQSAISYAVSRLQESLGLPLLDLKGRRAVLTDAGAFLLADVTPLLDGMLQLERRAKAMAQGGASRIRLHVDCLFPKQRLFYALHELAEHYPHVEVSLQETVRQIKEPQGHASYDLAILMNNAQDPRQSDPLLSVELLAVAHADHPLFSEQAPLDYLALSRHLRCEIRSTESQPGPDEGRLWRMNTMETALEAVRQGLCYGWLPRGLMAQDLVQGTLKALPLASGASRLIALGLHFADDSQRSDPAVSLLARLLAEEPTAENA